MNTIEKMAAYQAAVLAAETARRAWINARNAERDAERAYVRAQAAEETALGEMRKAIETVAA